jgi:hypothetical protein
MDIYDVIQAMRRQWRLLIIGVVVLFLLIFAAMFKVEDGSFDPRFAPRFESSIRMVVVPEQVSDLTDPSLTSPAFDTVAGVYGDLVAPRRSGDEIVETTGAQIDSLEVFTENNSPIITVVVEAQGAEDSKVAALGAYDWLVDRLKQGAIVAEVAPPSAATDTIDTSVRLIVEPRFDDADSTYWFDISTADGDGTAMPLYALRTGASFPARLDDAEAITLTIGPELGSPYDTATLTVPRLEEEPQPGIALEVVVGRGAVIFSADGVPVFNESALGARWDNPANPTGTDALTVLLLDDDPSPVQIGQRRGPIIGAGALIAGVLVLLALALMVDTFKQRKRMVGSSIASVGMVTPIALSAPVSDPDDESEEPDHEGIDEYDEDVDEYEEEDEDDLADDSSWSWKQAARRDDDIHPWSARTS